MSQFLSPSERQLANADTQNQVLEYLVKKGYTRTEQTLRQEAETIITKGGNPEKHRAEEFGTLKYWKAFKMLREWIEGNLDIYKVRLMGLACQSHTDLTHSLNFGVYCGLYLSTPFSSLSLRTGH